MDIPAEVFQILSILLGGGLIGIVLKHRRDYPGALAAARRTGAEAERLHAETEDINLASMERQISRLDRRVELLESQVEECHQDRDLALAAARYLLDRLTIANPHDEAIEKLRPYLSPMPDLPLPLSMKRRLRDIDEAGRP